ncbi:AAA family ATPase [Mycobacterium spongiae]|uniref:MinD/ParA family ATP-binding protein n=1 Tax=Mycobacterium spongiae TaxID=886343 RepID=UPI003CCEC24C
MSEHPTTGAPRRSPDGEGAADHPTVQLPRQQYCADPPAETGDSTPSGSFAAFRTEQQAPAPGDDATGAVPQTASAESPPWDSEQATGPVAGLPRVDPTAFGAYYGGPTDPPPQPPHRPEPASHSRYPELSTSMLLRQPKPPPSEGWRRLLYMLSGQLVNLGEGPRATHYNDLVARVNRPLRGCYRIALLSLKGGVGKTTITATLGATFASLRGDRVIAVDANPERGNLGEKVPVETLATVRHLLRDADDIERYSDVRGYTSQDSSGLEVLASDPDPAVSEAFSADDYTRALEMLERYYGLLLSDCGTGLLHSAMSAVLAKSDVLVVVSSASIDGARSASATLDWLEEHGHEDLVRNSVAVVNAVRPSSGKVDLQKLIEHFSRRCRAVHLVPFDPHLEEGAEITLERLKRETRLALTELAAVVAEGLPSD